MSLGIARVLRTKYSENGGNTKEFRLCIIHQAISKVSGVTGIISHYDGTGFFVTDIWRWGGSASRK